MVTATNLSISHANARNRASKMMLLLWPLALVGAVVHTGVTFGVGDGVWSQAFVGDHFGRKCKTNFIVFPCPEQSVRKQ